MSSRGIIMLVYLTVLISVISILVVPVLHAEAVDPTRPPLSRPRPAPVAQPKINPKDYVLTSILLSEHRKVAVINDQVVTLGDSVTTAAGQRVTVTAISATEVRLRKARREFVVRLPSTQFVKSALSVSPAPQTQGQE